MSKYYAYKAQMDGHMFDSKKELNRYLELKDKENKGEIKCLELQKPYNLIPSQKIDGKVVERPCKYIADFVYEEDGKTVVEDVKGYRRGTAYSVFAIKRKLMLWLHGIRVREI